MEEAIGKKVQILKDQLGKVKNQILEDFRYISGKLNKMAITACAKVSEFEDILNDILEDLTTKDSRMFPKLNECLANIGNLDNWHIPKYNFLKTKFNESCFEFQELTEPFSWQKKFLHIYCEHLDGKTYITRCKNPHCCDCLKKLLENNDRVCPCGIDMSTKDRHMILGFPNVS
jgi:hypothetical protein